MFNKAEEWGFREEGTNPCHHVAKNKRRKCERFLSEVEYGRAWRVDRQVWEALLGHTKIENTARYTHFDDTHLFEIADFISGLIDAAMLGREVGR